MRIRVRIQPRKINAHGSGSTTLFYSVTFFKTEIPFGQANPQANNNIIRRQGEVAREVDLKVGFSPSLKKK
jgi:hypothetical protein